ncbi:MAG: hypothetical protein KF870_02045 [Leadbetterella sp.]|nr:hypothetical protein [Leadbetterella sp.]
MRPVLLILFFTAFLLGSCSKKEVTLSPIDTFTGGKSREWLIVENFFSGENFTASEECFKDDTVLFSKGDEDENIRYPIYIWKKNNLKCEAGEQDVKLFFVLEEDLTKITFYSYIDGGNLDPNFGTTWNIDVAENSEIRLSQGKGTNDERRLRLVPYNAPRDSSAVKI